MKRIVAILLVLLVALLATASLGAGAAGPFDSPLVSFRLNGYCDGMTLQMQPNGLVLGQWTSPCAVCPGGPALAGTAGRVPLQGQVATLANSAWPHLFTVVRANHTWTNYNMDGSVFTEGTWTECEVSGAALQSLSPLPSSASAP